MNISGVYNVRGRGTVAVVKDLPRGVLVGCLLHQGDLAWTITGIEHMNPARTGDEIGLVLRPIGHTTEPQIGAFDL